MSTRLEDNQVYAMIARSRPNEYVNNMTDSERNTKPRQEPGLCSSPRVMASNSNVSIRKNDTQNVNNNFGIELPSLPVRNCHQQTFVKRADSSSPITIPSQNGHHHAADPHNTPIKQEHTRNVCPGEERDPNDFALSNYIIPSDDPPPYTDMANSSMSQPGNDASSSSRHKPNGPRDRFDSGLGDSESFRGSSVVRFSGSPSNSSQSVSSPRLSTQFEQHYEDIDQYSKKHPDHHQTNLQSLRNRSEAFGEKNASVKHVPSHVDNSGVTNSDTEDNDLVVNTSMAEAIQEPLHDPRVGSLPHTYMPLRTSIHKEELFKSGMSARSSCSLIVGLVAALLISCIALSLGIYILVSTKAADFKDGRSDMLFTADSNSNVSTDNYDQDIIDLKNKIDNLTTENAALKDSLLSQERKMTSYIEEKITQLSDHQQNLSNSLGLIEKKFQAQISLISLTPGPQGPPGIVNFSLCVSRSIAKSAIASKTESTESSYLPSEVDILKYFVTFAYCSYSGATDAYLESMPSSSNNNHRYRCKCWGIVPEESWTLCKVTIWMCPNSN